MSKRGENSSHQLNPPQPDTHHNWSTAYKKTNWHPSCPTPHSHGSGLHPGQCHRQYTLKAAAREIDRKSPFCASACPNETEMGSTLISSYEKAGGGGNLIRIYERKQSYQKLWSTKEEEEKKYDFAEYCVTLIYQICPPKRWPNKRAKVLVTSLRWQDYDWEHRDKINALSALDRLTSHE